MKPTSRLFALACLGLSVGALSDAQTVTKPAPVVVPVATPRPSDVGSIDGMINAFYEVICGPAGQPRQWSRDRTLYIPDVRFVQMSVDKQGKPEVSIVTPQQFADNTNAGLVATGFEEREIHRVTERFGNIAHVFSTYEMRRKAGGPVTGRGINSIELFWDGQRWWIASAIWDDERPDNPLPKEFLP